MWFLALLNNSWVRKIGLGLLAALVGGVVLWAAYTHVYNLGYSKAASECQAKAVAAQLTAETQKYNDLNSQYIAAQKEINTTSTEKQAQTVKAKKVIEVINHEIKDNVSCNLDANAIGVLNSIRTGNSNSASNSK
jgi:hypothetical protein